jgi:aminoacyl-tRNA hydrolase
MPKNKPNQAQNTEENSWRSAPPIGAIIGLGNPGADYKNTYHNIGLSALDWLRENYGHEKSAAPKTVKGFFEYRKENGRIWIKSTVSMNESGAAVRRALKYFSLRPEEILIIHDDSDLEIGGIKLSWDRGSAGHKGIGSVMRHLGTKKLWRLRIGIRSRSQTSRREKASEFVLKKIRRSDEKMLHDAFENAAKIIGLAPHEN